MIGKSTMIEFYFAYCRMYGWNPIPFFKDRKLFGSTREYIYKFLNHYNNMRSYLLEPEVREFMRRGDNFFEACREWDV